MTGVQTCALPICFPVTISAEKFDKVFRNLDKVDFTEAVNNIWTNHVEDRYFGKGFKDMTDALEAFGLELPSLKL